MNNIQLPQQQQQQQQQANMGGGGGGADAVGRNQEEAMRLRRTELERSLLIKQEVEQDERINHKNITDFEFVQWSLTTNEFPMEVVVERIYRMQCFRDQYNIHRTLEECADLWCQLTLNLLPGCFIAFDYLPLDKCFVVVSDLSKYNPGMIQTENDYRVWLGGVFYLHEAANQNFQTMRKGMTVMNECANLGFSMSDVISNHGAWNRNMLDFFLNYPRNEKEYYFVNSPMAMNCLYGIVKHMIPPERRNAYKLGNQIPGLEGRSMTALYHVPSEAASTARVLKGICDALEVRYQNQARFSFSESAKFLID